MSEEQVTGDGFAVLTIIGTEDALTLAHETLAKHPGIHSVADQPLRRSGHPTSYFMELKTTEEHETSEREGKRLVIRDGTVRPFGLKELDDLREHPSQEGLHMDLEKGITLLDGTKEDLDRASFVFASCVIQRWPSRCSTNEIVDKDGEVLTSPDAVYSAAAKLRRECAGFAERLPDARQRGGYVFVPGKHDCIILPARPSRKQD